MKVFSKESFIWINVFISLLSLLLCIFFFTKVYQPNKALAESFDSTECKIISAKILKKLTFGPCNIENLGLWWYNYFKPQFINDVVMKGSDPKPLENSSTESSGFFDCYQGNINVEYQFENHKQFANITGLFSSDYTWVQGYMDAYDGEKNITCYYKKTNPYCVIPFKPIISNTGKILGSIFATILVVSFLLVIIFIVLKIQEKKKKSRIRQSMIQNKNINNINSPSSKQDILSSTINFKGFEISLSTSTNQKSNNKNTSSSNNNNENKNKIIVDSESLDDDDDDDFDYDDTNLLLNNKR